MEKSERAVPDSTKVFDKSKKPTAGLDKTKSFRPKKKIKEGTRGKHQIVTSQISLFMF